MQSISLLCKDSSDLAAELNKNVDSNFSPNLAFVFASPTVDISEVDALFRERDIEYIGCSTAGEIQNKNLLNDGLSTLLCDLKGDSWHLVKGEYDSSVLESAKHIATEAKAKFENFGIILFSGGIAVDGAQIVNGIKEIVGKEIPLFGGLAGDSLNFLKTFAYASGFKTENGYAALIFNTDKVKLEGLATSGWDGMGMNNTITKASNNVVFEINNEPALDEVMKYFGQELFDFPEDQGDVMTFPDQFPLEVSTDKGSSFLRAIVYTNIKDRSLIMAGSVPEGSTFKYCPNPDISVVTETVSLYDKNFAKKEDIDAVLMISCLIRFHSFGPLFAQEVDSIYNLWEKPMAGFLSYGEIGNTGDQKIAEFHNATCSLVALKEVA